MSIIICKNVGVSGTTEVHVKEQDGVFEARVGIAIMGHVNMTEDQFEACQHNPFHEGFYDNYSQGFGATVEEAIEDMKKDMEDTAESLWAF